MTPPDDDEEKPDPVATQVFRRLLSTIVADGRPQWELASPYLLRHAAEHAQEAGVLPFLFRDGEFLVHGHPRAVLNAVAGINNSGRSTLLPVYRTSLATHVRASAPHRRQILAVDALRHGHDGLARSLYNPPGAPALPWQCRWATSSTDSLARRAVLIGQTGPIRGVALGRVGHEVVAVTVGAGRVAHVWNLLTASQVGVLRGHVEPLTAVAVGRDATRSLALTGDEGGKVWCWELPIRKARYHYALGGDAVRCLMVDAVDDRLIGIAGDDGGRIRLWDVANETTLHTADLGSPVRWLVPGGYDDQPLVVAGSESGAVLTVDLLSGVVNRIVDSSTSPMTALECSSLRGEPVVVTAYQDGTATARRLDDGDVLTLLKGSPGSMSALCVIENGPFTVVITGGEDGHLRLWDLDEGWFLGTMFGRHDSRVTAITWCADQRRPTRAEPVDDPVPVMLDLLTRPRAFSGLQGLVALSVSADKSLRTWYPYTLLPLQAFAAHTGAVTDIKMDNVHGEPVAITASDDGTAAVWDPLTQRARSKRPQHPQPVDMLASRRIGGRVLVASGCGDAVIRLFNATEGKQFGRYEVGAEPLSAIGLGDTANGPVVVTATLGGTVTARFVADGKPLWRENAAATHLEVGGTGPHSVVGLLADDTVTFRDLETGTGHPAGFGTLSEVSTFTFGWRNNEVVVAAGHHDGITTVWTPWATTPIHTFAHPEGQAVVHVAMRSTPGSPVVAAQYSDGAIWLWSLKSGYPVILTSTAAPIATRLLVGEAKNDTVVLATHNDRIQVWDANGEFALWLPDTVGAATMVDSALMVAFDRELALFVPDGEDAPPDGAQPGTTKPLRLRRQRWSRPALAALVHLDTEPLNAKALKDKLPKGTSSTILRATLQKLVKHGLVEWIHTVEPDGSTAKLYALLPAGRELVAGLGVNKVRHLAPRARFRR